MYAAILLAAGKSERMGCPKGLLTWEGKPLIQHQIDEIQKSKINDIIVVLGHQVELYKPLIPNSENIKLLSNETWQQGKSSSIRMGLTGLTVNHQAVLFVNIDQPLCFQIVNQMIDSYEKNDGTIQIPVHGDKKGHPILIPTRLMDLLQRVKEETQGLKGIIRSNPDFIHHVQVTDSSILYNFNTRDHFEGRT